MQGNSNSATGATVLAICCSCSDYSVHKSGRQSGLLCWMLLSDQNEYSAGCRSNKAFFRNRNIFCNSICIQNHCSIYSPDDSIYGPFILFLIKEIKRMFFLIAFQHFFQSGHFIDILLSVVCTTDNIGGVNEWYQDPVFPFYGFVMKNTEF